MTNLEAAVAIYIAYLIGSFSSAIVVCRIMGLPDPRTQGSRNPGATNVLRLGGKKAAIITLLGDLLKGLLPVLVAKWIGFDTTIVAFIALGAFLGHLFPIFFRFEGGKGVATMLGCLLALSWPVGLCWIATWVTLAILFRYSSLAALLASVVVPFYAWYFTHHLILTAVILVMSLMVIARHYGNIKNLLAGKESKIGKKT